MQLRIRYEVHEAGWAEAEFESEHAALRMTVSYIGGGLRELIDCAIGALAQIPDCSLVFADEPGGHRISFRSFPNAGRSFVEVRRLDDFSRSETDAGRQSPVVVEFEATSLEFARAVNVAASRVLEGLGQAEYKRRWRSDFPLSELQKLKARLNPAAV